jgi:ankyrin repeat protein
LAARRGHVGVVEILLRNKAAVNAQNSEGHSPLHEAVIGGHSEVARLLLANHADVNSKDKRGSTPLHDAFYDRKNQKKLAELLLDNHATVDAEDNEGRTPFKVAVGMAEKETIELLLARGATADVFDAVASGCLEKLKELLNADPSLVKSRNVNHSYRTALHYAAENGDKEAVRMLLDLGADANSATEERVRSSSSGGLAAAWSDEATAKQKSGWTPLHYAAERGHTETVALLVGRGANRNAECGDGRTPMHLAAPKAHIDVLKVLLNKKPMQIAVEAGYTAAIKTLLTKRPNINAKDHRGQTPLRLSSHDNARQWLSRHGARE